MNELLQNLISCPYCGESIDVLIDIGEAGQEYIEDCQVCCRPIVFHIDLDASGEPVVTVRDENDTF